MVLIACGSQSKSKEQETAEVKQWGAACGDLACDATRFAKNLEQAKYLAKQAVNQACFQKEGWNCTSIRYNHHCVLGEIGGCTVTATGYLRTHHDPRP
jgi:hypothetical protein